MFILHLVYEVYVPCFFCLLFVMLIIHHGIWNLMVCLELMDPFFNMFNNSHSNKHDKYTNENNDHYYHSYCYFYFSLLNWICWISIYERKNRQKRILILINKLGKLEIMSSHFKCCTNGWITFNFQMLIFSYMFGIAWVLMTAIFGIPLYLLINILMIQVNEINLVNYGKLIIWWKFRSQLR